MPGLPEKCRHDKCKQDASWRMWVGNGDNPVCSCNFHLQYVAKIVHDERASRVVGRTFYIRSIKD